MKILPILINWLFRECTALVSYENYVIFDFEISTRSVKLATKAIDKNYEINWLKPHEGGIFQVGTDVSLLVKPADVSNVETALQGRV